MSLRQSFPVLLAAAALAACQTSPPQQRATDDSAATEAPAASAPRDAKAPAAESQATRSAEASRPAPAPRPQPVVIPEGTTLSLALESTVSSATNRSGDVVVARLTEPVRVGEKVLFPEGSRVSGRVTAAVPSGRVKGRARLAFTFHSIEWKGRTADITTNSIDITAGSNKKHDAAVVGVGAGAGALIGGIAKGGKGAAVGALIGAGAGGGAVLATKGKEVQLDSGQLLQVHLEEAARIG
jgi:hypothetical protein